MIDVRVVPEELSVDSKTRLTVELFNRGETPCWMVAMEIRLPPSVSLMVGDRLFEVERIDPGGAAQHEVEVCARREGEWEVEVSELSFHTDSGRLERLTNLRRSIRVLPRAVRSVEPPPTLTLEVSTSELPLDEWVNLEGTVRHGGGAGVEDLEVRLSGPLQIDRNPAWRAPHGLEREGILNFCVPVRFVEPGRHVPLHLVVAYRDAEGRSGVQRDVVSVRVKGNSPDNPPSDGVIPILMITANPRGDARTEEEQRALIDILRRGKGSERFSLSLCPAATPRRVMAMLQEVKPRIVHFSGHGTEGALTLQDEFDGAAPMHSGLVAELFRLLSDHVECVVLNACFSEATARRVSRHIPFVVGMHDEIYEQSARSFATGFFEALAGDQPIDRAFEWGCLCIEADRNPGLTTPVLFHYGVQLETTWTGSGLTNENGPKGGALDEQVQTE